MTNTSQQSVAPSTDQKPLTAQEAAILEVVRINKQFPRKSVSRAWRIGRWAIKYERRSKENLWGRFGGGWNWKVGIAIGGTTVILDLLVSSVRISRVSP